MFSLHNSHRKVVSPVRTVKSNLTPQKSTERIQKISNVLALLFFFSSAALALFGLFSQLLGAWIHYDQQLLLYFLGTVPALFVFLLFYTAVAWYCDGKNWFQTMALLLLLAGLLWSLFLLRTIFSIHLDPASFAQYAGHSPADARQEIQRILSRCRCFGHGSPYYTYADTVLKDASQPDLPLYVQFAFRERQRAEEVFRNFRQVHTLPVLSYCFGHWIRTVYTAIAAAWMLVGAAVSFQVYRWWEKWTYFFCYLTVLLQLLLPLLEAYGILVCGISYPFGASLLQNITLVLPQLGVMLGLVKVSRPAGPLLMVPDDAFWKEIVD